MHFKNNKFGSREKKDKPIRDGYVFDSNAELKRYCELKMLIKAGIIKDLEVHPKFTLRKSSKNEHKQSISKWSYKADFAYIYVVEDYKVVEDVKSLRISKSGGKFGTATLRDYKLTRNEFMRQHPGVKFIEISY